MALVGTLSTMPLPDLLQWLGSTRRTGTLQVERNKVVKRILFNQGRIVACSSNDPNELLGHFLVSRGRIDEATLRRALGKQEVSGQHLGAILVSMKALTSEDLIRHLSDKAEETVFSLFEWEQAVFRFHDEPIEEADIPFPVSLEVQDVLLRGLQRYDEMRRIRQVIPDASVVPAPAVDALPDDLARDRTLRALFECVDGSRSVAQLALETHMADYHVRRALFQLHARKLVTLAPSAPAPQPAAAAKARARTQVAAGGEVPGQPPPAASDPAAAPAASEAPSGAGTPTVQLDKDLEVARRLLARHESEAALEILNAAYKAHPGDDRLGRMLREAEAAFVDDTYRQVLPPEKVPVLKVDPGTLTGEKLSPMEFFLISRVDGNWDLKSIIQISPMREVDALRTLKRMVEQGVLELQDPD